MSTPLSITTRLGTSGDRKRWVRVAVGSTLVGVLILIGLLASLAFGAVDISFGEVIDVLFGSGEKISRQIIIESRLPRALAAVLVGCNLAVSGTLLQAVTRNPLADPGLFHSWRAGRATA